MAEVMLHRTKASQVEPVYLKFIEKYPCLDSLRDIKKSDLKERLYSLGLAWRVDEIYDMINIIITDFEGEVPISKKDLLSLPGISDYIASAVRCFAWGFPEGIIDTNTVRIIGRLFLLPINDSSRRNKTYKYLIAKLVDPDNPRFYNFALLDLANKICFAKKFPRCDICPIAMFCLYSKKNRM